MILIKIAASFLRSMLAAIVHRIFESDFLMFRCGVMHCGKGSMFIFRGVFPRAGGVFISGGRDWALGNTFYEIFFVLPNFLKS